MLLTGFDAPQAQVLYLDRLIQEAELLQAVARVNRTAPKKSSRVGGRLLRRLGSTHPGPRGVHPMPKARSSILMSTGRSAHLPPRSRSWSRNANGSGRSSSSAVSIRSATDYVIETCVQLLADERLRAEFDVALRTFLSHLRHRPAQARSAAFRRGCEPVRRDPDPDPPPVPRYARR